MKYLILSGSGDADNLLIDAENNKPREYSKRM